MKSLEIVSNYEPSGGQPKAIHQLVENFNSGEKFQTLLGVTGSGKTYTVANVIEKLNKPTLVISQNKTLAAQLFSEFTHFFPNNRVEYFVSYYDYYMPEAYLPQTDTYIAKDSSINEEIEKYRLSTTCSLLERKDVIVIASVSCIYGLGAPDDFAKMQVKIEQEMNIDRDEFLMQLVDIQYSRNDIDPFRGNFSVIGDVVTVYPSYRDEFFKIEFWGDTIEKITIREILTNHLIEEIHSISIFPASHFVTPQEKKDSVIRQAMDEMKMQVRKFESEGKLVEAQRIYQRTVYDMEMLKELGYCSGIENYSRYLTGRNEGDRPYTLLDFFPKDSLIIVDESHVSIPQFRGMFKADRSRKETLVENGFRLPSALDNRPLNFDEFEDSYNQVIFTTATPGPYELEKSVPVNLFVRPTGLLDPSIEIRPLENQIDDLIAEIREKSFVNERVIVTCLTKRTSEDLTDYLKNINIKAQYIHSDVDVIERISILKDLRSGKLDCLIGINLLREGIDLPEVSLVAVLDADKEGFLRSKTALTQISGRAARHIKGHVIFYANKITESMQYVLNETKKRRKTQEEYNKKHNITPKSIQRPAQKGLDLFKSEAPKRNNTDVAEAEEDYFTDTVEELTTEMLAAADALEFERAGMIRDHINNITGEKKKKSSKKIGKIKTLKKRN